jgi:hypothetical protein
MTGGEPSDRRFALGGIENHATNILVVLCSIAVLLVNRPQAITLDPKVAG